VSNASAETIRQELFGIWRNNEKSADVPIYPRKLGKSRVDAD